MHNIEVFTKNTPVDINDDSFGLKRAAYRGVLCIDSEDMKLSILICPKDPGGEVCATSDEHPPKRKVIRITDPALYIEYKTLLCDSDLDAVGTKIIQDHLAQL